MRRTIHVKTEKYQRTHIFFERFIKVPENEIILLFLQIFKKNEGLKLSF